MSAKVKAQAIAANRLSIDVEVALLTFGLFGTVLLAGAGR
jgi:hypothetical protein